MMSITFVGLPLGPGSNLGRVTTMSPRSHYREVSKAVASVASVPSCPTKSEVRRRPRDSRSLTDNQLKCLDTEVAYVVLRVVCEIEQGRKRKYKQSLSKNARTNLVFGY